jgi:hypothetical protein
MRFHLSLAAGFVLAGIFLFAIGPAPASTPPAGVVNVPTTAGGTASDTWIGTIPPGTNPASDCAATDPVGSDEHDITINAPPGGYTSVSATFTFQITWTPGTPTEDTADEILTVIGPDGSEIGSSDGGSTTETVTATNLPTGVYRVLACGFINAAPQNYSGSLVVKTAAASGETSLPSSGTPLQFSAAVPADNQRDESEPLMEIDKAGNMYACGPTGFSNLADYAQVSTDGGNQFHLLGTPPRGQQGAGGGGDCGLATAYAKNSQGNYQYAYTGLGPLTGFVTSTSPNNGHSLATGGPFGNGVTDEGGGADRQWMTFTSDPQTVLLSYNQQVPRNIVVQKSTDGGLTYGPISAIAGSDARFPGPMRYDPARNLVFFGWDRSNDDGTDSINLSISRDGGTTWTNCVAATAQADAAGFVVADSDSAGNIYLAYAEKQRYHTYLVVLPAASVSKCDQPVSQNPLDVDPPTSNPGFSKPVQVDRDAVRTTVFPWLVAGGAPGRVAVTFYGTTQDGDPNTNAFKAAWDVYVNQSLNALSPTATFSQAKATTHPFHYDSICLNGLACDTTAPGDRSLADFFAIDLNPATNRLSVVFNRAEKKPDESAGHVATPMVVNQIGGPTNTGATLPSSSAPLRTSSTDPAGDALSSYSLLGAGVPPPAPPTKNEAADDLLSVAVAPEVDFHTGLFVPNGGFTVTMKLASLSNTALQAAMTDTGSQSLLWVFRFVNGYQAVAASARWNLVQGFTFGYNDYRTGANPCASSPVNEDKCVIYPGDTPIQGNVDQAAGTISLSIPRYLLRALGPPDANGRPTEVPATVGSRFYDAAAFTLGNNASITQDLQTFLYPLDNNPAMDFLLPSTSTGGGGGGSNKGGCMVNGGGSIVGTGTDGKFSIDAHESGKGNVYYRDPGANVDFRSTGKVTVTCVGSSAQIKGTGDNNKTDSGTFTVNVVDNGEPGTADTFGITLTNPSYTRSGLLIRGNLQVKNK